MYYYEHQNGSIIEKPDVVVDTGGGPNQYFEGPMVKRWWHELDPAKTVPPSSPALGDNLPPLDYDALSERLTEDYSTLSQRRDELLAAFERAPEAATDEDTANKLADFTKQLHACLKNAESHRKSEKETYLEGGRRVDGWFKKVIEPLGKAKKEIERRLTDYQRQIAAEERRRREIEEARAREVARLAAEEAAKAAAAVKNEADLASAIEAEEAAKQAAIDAAKAAQAAEAKAAELSRSRSDYGSVASLRSHWTGELVDRATLDLEALRQHLGEEALNKAIRSFVKSGGRELRGARVWEDQTTTVR